MTTKLTCTQTHTRVAMSYFSSAHLLSPVSYFFCQNVFSLEKNVVSFFFFCLVSSTLRHITVHLVDYLPPLVTVSS